MHATDFIGEGRDERTHAMRGIKAELQLRGIELRSDSGDEFDQGSKVHDRERERRKEEDDDVAGFSGKGMTFVCDSSSLPKPREAAACLHAIQRHQSGGGQQ